MSETKYVPDIMEVITDLSNDEVRTPPRIANQVLDLLPDEVWTNSTYRWLDPGTKSGVFLREATKRLMVGLKTEFPDEQERLEHILNNQVFGLAVTSLGGLMSRRALYCSKDATSDDSVIKMPKDSGNIWHERVSHKFKNSKCTECGANSKVFGSLSDENHAYAFIHEHMHPTLESELGMQFDVIVGNPPYQLNDSSDTASATPLYNEFVETAKAMSPKYIAMVIPSRWMGGGKGLDKFRTSMLEDKQITKLVDYFNAAELFPQVGINGGVCYFLWERGAVSACLTTTHRNEFVIGPSLRALNEHDIFIRDERAAAIIRKINFQTTFSSLISTLKPFGLRTFNMGSNQQTPTKSIKLFQRGGIGWVGEDEITSGKELLKNWKVFILAVGSGREREKTITDTVYFKPLVSGPNSACTETYLAVGPFASEIEAENVAAYMRTKFVRFLVSTRKSGQHINRSIFSFVPVQDWSKPIDDVNLYKKYKLSADEIDLIESSIKEMPAS